MTHPRKELITVGQERAFDTMRRHLQRLRAALDEANINAYLDSARGSRVVLRVAGREVTCGGNPAMNNAWWFFANRVPLAGADQIEVAVEAVKEMIAARTRCD